MKFPIIAAATTAVLGLVVLIPAPVNAEKAVPICSVKESHNICYHAYDAGDCYVEDGIERCRTITFYRWYPF